MRTTPFSLILLMAGLMTVSSCEHTDDFYIQDDRVNPDKVAQQVVDDQNTYLHEVITGLTSYHDLRDEIMVLMHEAEQDRLFTLTMDQLNDFYLILHNNDDPEYQVPAFTGVTDPSSLRWQLDLIKQKLDALLIQLDEYPHDVAISSISAVLAHDIVIDQTEYPPNEALGTPCWDAFQAARRDAYDRFFISTVIMSKGGRVGLAAALSILGYDLWSAGVDFCNCFYREYGYQICSFL